jgi:hypothetical protein
LMSLLIHEVLACVYIDYEEMLKDREQRAAVADAGDAQRHHPTEKLGSDLGGGRYIPLKPKPGPVPGKAHAAQKRGAGAIGGGEMTQIKVKVNARTLYGCTPFFVLHRVEAEKAQELEEEVSSEIPKGQC